MIVFKKNECILYTIYIHLNIKMPFILNENLINDDELTNLNVSALKQLCKQEGHKNIIR